MKVEREGTFTPIHITLETKEEADALLRILDCDSGDKLKDRLLAKGISTWPTVELKMAMHWKLAQVHRV